MLTPVYDYFLPNKLVKLNRLDPQKIEQVMLYKTVYFNFLQIIFKCISKGSMIGKWHKNLKKFCADFQYFDEKKGSKRVRPKIVFNGFDRAKKTAQDVGKKTSKKHAHSTLIQPER